MSDDVVIMITIILSLVAFLFWAVVAQTVLFRWTMGRVIRKAIDEELNRMIRDGEIEIAPKPTHPLAVGGPPNIEGIN